MPPVMRRAYLLTLGLLLTSCDMSRNYYLGELAPLPGIGLAGAFCGASNEVLVVAGGSNYPDKRPWDGGAKHYSDRILALEYRRKGTDWQESELRLPHATAYGVSVRGPRGTLCIGGTDGTRCHKEAYEITSKSTGSPSSLELSALPSLPAARAFACAARTDRRIYVFGGIESPTATRASAELFYLSLDAVDAGWKRAPPLPAAGRILAAAGARGDNFYVVGGCELRANAEAGVVREYLRDVWRFDGRSWTEMPPLPAARAGCPSPLPAVHDQLLVVGGDSGDLGGVDLRDRHPGFRTTVFGLAADDSHWTEWPDLLKHRGPDPKGHPELGQMPPVTAPTVELDRFWVIASGEIRPGVRSTRMNLFVAGDESPGRAWLVIGLLVGLGVVPMIVLLIWAFRVHARSVERITDATS